MECEPIIRIENLRVQHGSTQILKNVSLAIPKNRITVILGPSGCGKTTLLRCLNRLTDLYPELSVDGRITIDGENVLQANGDLTRLRQKMGLLSQRPYPLPMSIFKNVAYGLKLRGIRDKADLRGKVEHYLRVAGLWNEVSDRLDSQPHRLSLGQQQRLCLARGLAVGPEILLADEPTSALDPISSRIIEEEFRKLRENYTIIVVTHILRQARRLADYVIFMYYGEVVEEGPPEILLDPQSDGLKEYVRVGH
jgi:phosphate transport system ATP-binding protein